VRTQAKHTSGSYCEYNLSIRDYFGTVYVDTYFNTDDGWSEWIAMQVPRDLEFVVVEIHPATMCSSGPGTADVRIELESSVTVTPTKSPTAPTPPPVPTTPPPSIPPSSTPPPPPTTPPPVSPAPEPDVTFWADETALGYGECTNLNWQVEQAAEVRWRDAETFSNAHVEVCPYQTTTYVLEVVDADGQIRSYEVIVSVADAPTPPPPTPPPTEPPPAIKLLVVTHSGRLHAEVGFDDAILGNTWTVVHDMLDDRYGPEGYDLIDFAELTPDRMPSADEVDQAIQARWPQAQYWGIFILGGNLIIPYAQAANPMAAYGDTEPVWTDDLYADLDGDWLPDTPVARLPDAGDLGLLSHQLIPGIGGAGGFALVSHSPYSRYYPGGFINLFSGGVEATAGEWTPNAEDVDAAFDYFAVANCSSTQNNRWCYPDVDGLHFWPAFGPDQATSKGVIVSEASYAAAYCRWGSCHGHPELSISTAFLDSSATAFIGTTVTNYDPLLSVDTGGGTWDMLDTDEGIPGFTTRLLKYWSSSQNIFSAYFLAKVDTLQNSLGNVGTGTSALSKDMTWKMAHGLVFYGVPDPPAVCTWCMQCPSGRAGDCDGDGWAEDLEHWLVEQFKPVLVFDGQEPALDAYRHPDMQVYWQVSPIVWQGIGDTYLAEGHQGAWLTMVVAYREDFGSLKADAGSSIDLGVEELLQSHLGEDYHAGDTEAVRFFVEYRGGDPWDLNSWSLTHIDFKRHNDKFWDAYFGDEVYYPWVVPWPVTATADEGGEPASVGFLIDFMGLSYDGSHPILYVARNKHAMYPSRVACEEHREHMTPAILDFWITHEICGENGLRVLPDTPADHNVGERFGSPFASGNVFPLLSGQLEDYPGEYAWGDFDRSFCGSVLASGGTVAERVITIDFIIADVSQTLPACSGSMSKMWFPDPRVLELLDEDP
jgi:hypothetical protein